MAAICLEGRPETVAGLSPAKPIPLRSRLVITALVFGQMAARRALIYAVCFLPVSPPPDGAGWARYSRGHFGKSTLSSLGGKILGNGKISSSFQTSYPLFYIRTTTFGWCGAFRFFECVAISTLCAVSLGQRRGLAVYLRHQHTTQAGLLHHSACAKSYRGREVKALVWNVSLRHQQVQVQFSRWK